MSILFQCPWENAADWQDALRRHLPDSETLQLWPDLERPENIDIAIAWDAPAETWTQLPHLQAVLCLGAGVDGLLADGGPAPEIPIARLVDPLMADRMAEYVVGRVLFYHLRMGQYITQQAEQHWQRHFSADARDFRVAILGYGHLGRRVATMLRGVGFQLSAWSRRQSNLADIQHFHGPDGLPAMLAEADYLVILLPETAATRDLINAKTLAMVKSGAILINCARGGIVEETALIEALDSGALAAATLDVFKQEPLPEAHPFWQTPNLHITPHVSSFSDPESGAAILAEQVARLRTGQPLHHVVARHHGY